MAVLLVTKYCNVESLLPEYEWWESQTDCTGMSAQLPACLKDVYFHLRSHIWVFLIKDKCNSEMGG